LIPTEAIVPNNSIIIPPNTGAGMVFNNALTFPKTENKIPATAAIRITEGSVIFVRDMAPVTSE